MFGKCWCSEENFRTLNNIVTMQHPTKGDFLVDSCIASEIAFLCSQEINVVNSCCGRGKNLPSVIVTEDCYEKMEELGYKSYQRYLGPRVHILKTKACRTPRIIVFFGAPGSGKSTQGKLLEEKLNYKFISLGNVFRASNNRRIQEQLKTEKLFTDGEAFEVLQQELLKYDKIVLDGFPRNVNQLSLLNCGQFDIEDVICIKVSKDVAAARMTKRGRNQDTDLVIKKRLSAYFETEEQMRAEFLRQFGKRCTINGEDHPEIIAKNIINHLNF